MKMNPTIKRLFTIFSIGCLTGTNFFCGKPALREEELPTETVDTLISAKNETKGLFVLYEGVFALKPSTLSYFDIENRQLLPRYNFGVHATDMLWYGSKLYIVMGLSGVVDIIDPLSKKSIKSVRYKNIVYDGVPHDYVAAYKNNLFISSSEGKVAVIDTASLEISNFIELGTIPQQMVVFDGKLFVSNSNKPGSYFDSTISVIDLKTLKEERKITIGTNPNAIASDGKGNLFVSYGTGDPSGSQGIVKVNTLSNEMNQVVDTAAGIVRYFNDKLFFTGGYLNNQTVKVLEINNINKGSSEFITDGTFIRRPYALNVDESNGDVYIGDAENEITGATIYCFDKFGKKKFSFYDPSGIKPNTFVFYQQ
jgi:YVTN family beta-propeller protein